LLLLPQGFFLQSPQFDCQWSAVPKSPSLQSYTPTRISLGRRVNLGQENTMARYGKAAGKSVKSTMSRKKHGTLKSGKGGKGGTVKSRKQAIAIGLSEARKKGAKVPRK
jgi:hypothetical protein